MVIGVRTRIVCEYLFVCLALMSQRKIAGWGDLSQELAEHCVQALVSLADNNSETNSYVVLKTYAALLCVSHHWRSTVLKVSR